VSTKRISQSEIRKRALGKDFEAAPTYMPKILRAAWAWNFSRSMARKFNRELLKDRFKDLLKKLAKRFE